MSNMTEGIIGGYFLFVIMLVASRSLMPFLAKEVDSDSEFAGFAALYFLFFFIITLVSCGIAGYSTHQLLTKYLNVESSLIVAFNTCSWLLITVILCRKMLSYDKGVKMTSYPKTNQRLKSEKR